MIASPLRRLDCCLVTDGGGALVLTTRARARDLRQRPISILGVAETHTHRTISQMPDLTVTGAALTGPRAFAMAGLTPADVDVAEIYDSFTITVLLTLEDLGFCRKGESGAFVAKQRTAPGGDFPLNTQGGGLSYCHPGVFGIFTVIEGVRQLRGECGPRQVAGAEIALCHGTGGVCRRRAPRSWAAADGTAAADARSRERGILAARRRASAGAPTLPRLPDVPVLPARAVSRVPGR